jgi:hypothetical protein
MMVSAAPEAKRHRGERSIRMNEFVLLYRGAQRPTSPQEVQQVMQKWMAWFKDLAAKGHIVDRGQPLERSGKVVQTGTKTITDGPFAEAKDVIGGYSLIRASNISEAAELAKGCPVLDYGGHVEVRPVMKLDM